MATNPIYVETEEEIPEVVERLRQARGEDTMIVLPMRSRMGQSRFNFQLLRNYAARLGKRVTVVCDDPAVQKMASESGFPVFGAVGPMGEGIPSEAEAPLPRRRWWQGSRSAQAAHVGIAAPTKLITKNATELKPARFLLYIIAATLLVVGLVALAIYVPSASVTLVAQAQPFTEKNVEVQAQPGKAPIRVRTDIITRSNSQSFKTTGLVQVLLSSAYGVVVYSNFFSPPECPGPDCGSPGLIIPYGQRLLNTNGIVFAQTSNSTLVPWQTGSGPGLASANVKAVTPGSSGNVGSNTITVIENSRYDPNKLTVTNPQATGGGTDPSSTPTMTVADFDAGRAQLEAELRQSVAQQLASAGRAGEKLSATIIFSAPNFTTDHQPNDKVPSFSGTMTLKGEGDFYVDADVAKAFQTYLAQRVPNDQQLLPESPIQVSYSVLSDAAGGYMTFVGNASAYIAPRLDEATIRSAIVGITVTGAKFYLQRLPVRSYAIKEEPISLPLMPLLADRISLHYVVQSGAPSSAAAATTAPTPNASPPPSP
jgi:baseplate J-like protein